MFVELQMSLERIWQRRALYADLFPIFSEWTFDHIDERVMSQNLFHYLYFKNRLHWLYCCSAQQVPTPAFWDRGSIWTAPTDQGSHPKTWSGYFWISFLLYNLSHCSSHMLIMHVKKEKNEKNICGRTVQTVNTC